MTLPCSRFGCLARGLRSAAVAAGLVVTGAVAYAAAPAVAVRAVESHRVADIILLNDGFNAGLREGMVCRVTRSGREVGEILLVELRPSASAALILAVSPGQSIRAGDVAVVKVLKS